MHFATPHYILQMWVMWPLQPFPKTQLTALCGTHGRKCIFQWIRMRIVHCQVRKPTHVRFGYYFTGNLLVKSSTPALPTFFLRRAYSGCCDHHVPNRRLKVPVRFHLDSRGRHLCTDDQSALGPFNYKPQQRKCGKKSHKQVDVPGSGGIKIVI